MRRSIATSSEKYKLALAVSMGGMLELYDFLIYGLMAFYIAGQFFPADDSLSSLLGAFATFAIGYLTRPLGGFVFGYFGDRYSRKRAFALSIFLMGGSTALMGFLPNYEQIGIAAPILLVLLRLVQGFSLGGEIPGAITYLSESAPERPGLMVSILFVALLMGISFAAAVHGFLTLYLDDQAMKSWGWRIPFWFGGSLGIISYLIRKRFEASGFFLSMLQAKKAATVPVSVVFRLHKRGLICGLMIMALSSAVATIYGIYVPSYLSDSLSFDPGDIAWHTTLAYLMLAPVCAICGIISDLLKRKFILIFGAGFVAFSAWPIFQYMQSDRALLKTIMLICAFMTAMIIGLLPPLLTKCFPTEVRYTGITLCYNLSVTLFGGLAPFFATLLIRETQSQSGPAIYLIAVACFSMMALFLRWPEQDFRSSGT